jgi:hypothetical protein
MHNLNRLVIKALHRHEPHRRPRHRLANSFGIAPVILVALDVRLHIGRWHDSNCVPNFLKQAGPVMRTAARFHPHDRRRQLREKLLHLPTPQLTPQYDFTLGINPMNLEHVLR